MTDGPDALLELARTVAQEAAEHARDRRADGVRVAGTKSSEIDVVTEADRSTEALVRDRLLGARPDDGLIGEEGGSVPGSNGVRWIVDPIDGTVNYLYGLRDYAVSIAAEVDGEVVAAVVVAGATGVEYSAVRGGGAFRDGEPLSVRGRVPLSQALIATGFNYERDVRERQARAVARLLPQVRDIRRMGSCALDLCHVAAGELDGYAEEGPEIWDDAAGGLIAQEAGAVLRVLPGASAKRLVVCAPDHSFEELLEVVLRCGFAQDPAGNIR